MASRLRSRILFGSAVLFGLGITGLLYLRGSRFQTVAVGGERQGPPARGVVYPWLAAPASDGFARYCWSGGTPAACGQFDQGAPTGPWTYWWSDGSVQMYGSFEAGVQHGLWLIENTWGKNTRVPPLFRVSRRMLALWPPGAPQPRTIRAGEYWRGEWRRDLTTAEREDLLQKASGTAENCRCEAE